MTETDVQCSPKPPSSTVWPNAESQLAGGGVVANAVTKGFLRNKTNLTPFTLSQQYILVFLCTKFPTVTCELIRKKVIGGWGESTLISKVPFLRNYNCSTYTEPHWGDKQL